MPEGDTVLVTARNLHGALAGETITRSDFRVPKLAVKDLAGWTVRESVARGKHLLLRLRGPDTPAGADAAGDPGGLTLHSHLLMEGVWRTYRPGERWTGRPAHQIRVVLHTARVVAVGFHLHELALVPTAEEAGLVEHLGPDLLGPDWDPAEAVRRLAAHPATAIAEALLDQRNLAGVGNVYKSEILFLRGVSPWTPVSAVADLPAMVALTHRLLYANRHRMTRTTTGSLRRGETSYVYGRRGAPCRRCSTPIRKVEQADRVTYWCPSCQPAARPDEGPTQLPSPPPHQDAPST